MEDKKKRDEHGQPSPKEPKQPEPQPKPQDGEEPAPPGDPIGPGKKP